MRDTSLVGGWLPWFVFLITPVALVLSIGWTTGRWKRQLTFAVPIAAGFVLVAFVLNEHVRFIPYAFPFLFYLLAGLVVLALVVAIVGWRKDRNWQRIAAVVATVFAIVLVGIVVNRHYRYYPTVDALLGKVARNELGLPELNKISEQVASSGARPTKGYTVHVPIPGTTSGFAGRDAYIYLPPAYFATPTPQLPVILMLAGVPGGPENWLQAGNLDQVADEFANGHDGQAPILVMADLSGETNNDTGCTDSGRGKAETYLTVDVPAYVDATFHPATGKEHLGVAGLSVGGYCALMLPVRHPDLFSVFGDYSGFSQPTLDPPASALSDLFQGDQAAFDRYDPTKILPTTRFEGLSGWFEVGSEDPDPLLPTQQVQQQAAAAGIATCILVRPGGHDFGFWEQAFRNSLPWMSWKLGLTPQPHDLQGAVCTDPKG